MQKNCITCIYYEFYTGICYNTNSDGIAAFENPENKSCPFWDNPWMNPKEENDG